MNLLIIEDDNEIRAFLQDALKKEGFVVDTAEDGSVGFQKAASTDYDLIILDLTLPSKHGKVICQEIRALGKGIPILALSIQGDVTTKVDLLGIGVDDYVVKPFSYAELLARVRVLLRRPAVLQGEIFRIHDLVLDIRSRTLSRKGKQIHLTPKEFFLLEYLMRHQGEVLSRTALLEHVWDINADPFTNTIEMHVLNLRKKIEHGSYPKLIHSIRGTGYRFG